jgi:hypothetical protein
MLKELKLKPPAAQPFFVARHIDLTGVIVETLNKWYPAPAVPDTPPQPQGGPPQPGQAQPGQPIPGQSPPGQPHPGQPNPGAPGRPGGP